MLRQHLHSLRRNAVLLLLLYAACAGVWSWRFSTRNTEAARLVEQEREAARISADITQRLQGITPRRLITAAYQLGKLPAEELRDLQAWSMEQPIVRLRQLTVQSGPLHAPSPLNDALLLAEIRRPDTAGIDESRLMIAAAGDRLDPRVQCEALEHLASRAGKRQDHSLATDILMRAAECEGATWDTVLQLVEVARLARRPAAALIPVQRWIARQPAALSAVQLDQALDLQATLLLEGGRHAEASRIALDALRELPKNAPIIESALARAHRAALAAGEASTVLPFIQRFLAQMPEHQLTDAQIAADPQSSGETYRRWLGSAASIADASPKSDESIPMLLRVVATGDPRPLARLHRLPAAADSSQQLAVLLKTLETRPRHPLRAPDLARSLSAAGSADTALELLAAWLETHPQDVDADRARAQLLAKQKTGTAAAAWEAFLRRHPEDREAQRALAQAHLASGAHSRALSLLRDLPHSSLNDRDLRQIVTLAELADDTDLVHSTLLQIIQRQEKPAAADLLALTAASQQHSDPAFARQMLAEVVTRAASHAPLMAAWIDRSLRTAQAGAFSTAVEQVRPAVAVPEAK
jgi:DNA-binding SARP family transcriptional activator